jgi:glucose/mannose transport system substrate-binding protein
VPTELAVQPGNILTPFVKVTPRAAENQLKVFTWWTTDKDLAAYHKLTELYQVKYPSVSIVTGTETNLVSPQAGQIQTSDNPDVIQAQIGHALVDPWVIPARVQDLDDLYTSQKLRQAFPPDLLDIMEYQGHYYSVPVDIQRANMEWYNTNTFQKLHISVRSPENFADWLSMAAICKNAKMPALAIGDADHKGLADLFEVILIGNLGAQGYKNLWTGGISWSDPKVTASLLLFKQMMSYANPNFAKLSWQQAEQMVIDGRACTTISGDWVDSYNSSVNFSSAGWTPAPNNAGVFDITADTFALPQGANDPDSAADWLQLMGSHEAQMAVSLAKGTVCARNDCDSQPFDAYQQAAMISWKTDAIVPSLSQGAAINQAWLQDINNTLTTLVADQNLAVAQANLDAQCKNAGVCK